MVSDQARSVNSGGLVHDAVAIDDYLLNDIICSNYHRLDMCQILYYRSW